MRIIVAAFFAAGLLGTGASAQTLEEHWEICRDFDHTVDDSYEAVVSCSAAIDSGRLDATGQSTAYAMRGYARRVRSQFVEMLGDLERAIAINGANAWAHVNMGLYHERMNVPDRALRNFDDAIRVQPGDAELYDLRASHYDRRGDYDRAIADWDRAVQIDPRRSYPGYAYQLVRRGDRFGAAGQWDAAIRDYTAALALNDQISGPSARLNRGIAYRNAGQNDRALADIDAYLKEWPREAKAWTERGLVSLATNAYARANQDFTEAIGLQPNNATALAQRGVTYRTLNDLPRALADLDRAIQLNPRFAWALAERGATHYMAKDDDKAIQDLDRAAQIDPKDSFTWMYKARAYGRKGDLPRALQDYDRGIALFPNSVEMRAERTAIVERLAKPAAAPAPPSAVAVPPVTPVPATAPARPAAAPAPAPKSPSAPAALAGPAPPPVAAPIAPANRSITPTPPPAPARWSRTVTLNFDSIVQAGCVDATQYFGLFGVTVARQSAGTTVSFGIAGQCFHADVAVASGRNALYVQNNRPVSFSLNFDRPLRRVSFTRARLIAGPAGVNSVGWSATAYGATGERIAQVGEDPQYASAPNFIDSAPFTLSGDGIRSVVFVRTDPSGPNTTFGVSFPVIDDLVLTEQ